MRGDELRIRCREVGKVHLAIGAKRRPLEDKVSGVILRLHDAPGLEEAIYFSGGVDADSKLPVKLSNRREALTGLVDTAGDQLFYPICNFLVKRQSR